MKKEYKTQEPTIERLRKRLGRTFGDAAQSVLSKIAVSENFFPGRFVEVYDEVFVSENIENLFVYRNSATYCNSANKGGVIVRVKSQKYGWEVKALPLSLLTCSVEEYASDLKPTGKIIRGKMENIGSVYDFVSNCVTEFDVWKAIQGKVLRVVAMNSIMGARYNAAKQIVGIRERHIPVFCFVQNVKDTDSYNPRYFHQEYEIFKDEFTNKYGIRYIESEEIIVKPIFDDIRWGLNETLFSSTGILPNCQNCKDTRELTKKVQFVRFYNDEKVALCRIEELGNL